MSTSDTARDSRSALRHASTVVLLMSLGGGMLMSLGASRVPLLDVDEPRFAECSRQMLVTGDWMYPQFNGRPRFAKPPFFNWVQAAFFAVGGANELTARLPSLLSNVGIGLLIYWFCAAWRGRAAGILALALWFVLPQTYLWGKASVVDPLLTLLVTAALMTAFRGLEEPSAARWNWFLISGLMMGLSVLTKGPVGLVIPMGAYVLYVLFSGQVRKGLGDGAPWVALLIALVVSAPWFAAQIMRYGREYTDTFFGFDNIQRYTKTRESHWILRLVGCLWPLAAVMLFSFPVAILLPRGVKGAFKGLRAARSGETDARMELFLAVWLLTVVLLFAPSATKYPQYLMAAYPAGVILVAEILRRMLLGEAETVGPRWPYVVGFLVAGGMAGGAFAYAASQASYLAPKVHLDNVPLIAAAAWTLVGVLLVGAVVCAVAWGRGQARCATAALLAVGLATSVIMADVLWPAVGVTRDQGLKELSLICRDGLDRSKPIITYRLHSSMVAFYSDHRYQEVEKRYPIVAMALLRTHEGAWLLTHVSSLADLPRSELETVAARRQYVLVRMKAR